MPVYEYACRACGHEFEREQRISDAPIKKCPKCGALQAKRLISRTSFVLKGGGWYNDLYATPKPKSESGDKGGSSDAAPAKSEAASPATEKPPSDPGPKKGPGKGKGKGGKAAA
jgi:putative FmdB family regulatory protein